MFKELIAHLHALGEVTTQRPAEIGVYPSDIVSVPAGRTLVDLERFQAAPNRIKHKATLVSALAFSNYVNRFKGAETTVYVDVFGKVPKLVAVLDHHGKNAPSWTGHIATFTPELSMEWKAWKALQDGGPFDQTALVAFMEDHANDLHEPTPAKMLTAVKSFEHVENSTYKSAINLDNGNIELTYMKEGGQRKVQFPHTLTLLLPILENEPPVKLEGRIRYRVGNGGALFTFQFKQEPERLQRDALRAVAESVADRVKNVHLYEGTVGG